MTNSFEVLDLKSVYVYLNNTSLYVSRFKTKIESPSSVTECKLTV